MLLNANDGEVTLQDPATLVSFLASSAKVPLSETKGAIPGQIWESPLRIRMAVLSGLSTYWRTNSIGGLPNWQSAS